MSIPKEPRQLMINLMYLVLTALLALNVSAEVMNAFFSLDKGLKNSNAIVETTNSQILSNINKQADAYKNDQNEAYRAAAIEADKITKEFSDYVGKLWTDLFDAAGGPLDEEHKNQPKHMKDKEITTRMFVYGPGGNAANAKGVGFELEKKINETRAKLLELVGNDTALAQSIPLKAEDEWKTATKDKKNSWADWKFRQMPVAAVFPLLTKIQADAKASATTVLNHLFKQVSGEDIKFDAFEPVISASKSYIIKGEKYTADVFLSAYSTSSGGSTQILVNGSNLPVKAGKASYETFGSRVGENKYNVEIRVINPLTKEVKAYKKEFIYEVGERSVAISADKMNVFYIGVDNPVTVSAAGVSSNDLRVGIEGGGGQLKGSGSNFIVSVSKPTDECFINVSGGGMTARKQFRVKRIPDPVARLGNTPDGAMGNGEFKVQKGLIAWLDNFDFDAKCNIQGFNLVKVAKRSDPVEQPNQGGSFNGRAADLVRSASPGDTYYFEDVKARCPGDIAGRKINSMVFRIK
ncbi:MAG: gliding motility protein GldM [Saprospiraceae bacterium]|nr:MAG: gliding motility protein GldM [Saprospiraceae bacterium]